jgi:hypothetical protein
MIAEALEGGLLGLGLGRGMVDGLEVFRDYALVLFRGVLEGTPQDQRTVRSTAPFVIMRTRQVPERQPVAS